MSKYLTGDCLWGKLKSQYEAAKELNMKKASSVNFFVSRVEVEGNNLSSASIHCVLKGSKTLWKSSSPTKEASKQSWKVSVSSDMKMFDPLTLEISQDKYDTAIFRLMIFLASCWWIYN